MTRLAYVMSMSLVVLTMVGQSFVRITPKLIWNASASAPIGLYAVRAATGSGVTDLVAVDPPEPLASFLDQREYLPRGVLLMKRIAALPGQRVCRTGSSVTVDDIVIGEALTRDQCDRELPVWQGCHTLRAGEIFLMNWDVRDSLDGRYFGPIPISFIIGRVLPLWTDEGGDGRYQWRADTLNRSPTSTERTLQWHSSAHLSGPRQDSRGASVRSRSTRN